MKFIFAHPVYLQGIWVTFIYEGHRVKVKVTGAKQVDAAYSCNVKLRLTTIQLDPPQVKNSIANILITPLL